MQLFLSVERMISAYAGGFMDKGMKSFFCGSLEEDREYRYCSDVDACKATLQVQKCPLFLGKSDELRQKM